MVFGERAVDYSVGMRVLVDREMPKLGSVDAIERRHESWPALVTITRTSEADIKTRQLVVHIDGEHVATLLWGDSVTRELAPGGHRIRVHNTLVWKTVEFTLAPEEQVFFEAVNRSGPGTVAMTLLLGIGPLYVDLIRM
jgi:hypothetical protein